MLRNSIITSAVPDIVDFRIRTLFLKKLIRPDPDTSWLVLEVTAANLLNYIYDTLR
jgi:hypothetical protein